MERFILYFGYISTGISIIILPILGLIFYFKEKCISKLILFIGLLISGVGTFLQIISPVRKITMDEAGKIISAVGTPYSWYIGGLIFHIGLIVTTIGFALFIFKNNK